MLRTWQKECLSTVQKHYLEHKHFFCLATPGAGKTVLASEVAAYLFETNQIDFVVCFSPSTEVANGIKRSFSLRLNCNFDGIIGSIGCSYTYQNMRFFSEDNWNILKKIGFSLSLMKFITAQVHRLKMPMFGAKILLKTFRSRLLIPWH